MGGKLGQLGQEPRTVQAELANGRRAQASCFTSTDLSCFVCEHLAAWGLGAVWGDL